MSSLEQGPTSPESQLQAKGTSKVTRRDRAKSGPDMTANDKPCPSWHVNLPLKFKATVKMIQAQVLQNKGDEKTISDVISEAIDFYYHHIIKE